MFRNYQVYLVDPTVSVYHAFRHKFDWLYISPRLVFGR